MEFHYGRPGPIDFELLVRTMPDKEFQNLTRSTLPLLFFWRHRAEEVISGVSHIMGFPREPAEKICVEYQVPSIPRANPSFTDVMFVSREAAVAFEGKWREPPYDCVSDWRKGKDRADDVLQWWTGLIESRTDSKVSMADLEHCDYQMLHRMASACAAGGRRIEMIYQQFVVDDEPIRNNLIESLCSFCKAIQSPSSLYVGLQTVFLCTHGDYLQVKDQLDQLKLAEPDKRAQVVRRALLDDRLFGLAGESQIDWVCPSDDVARVSRT